MLYTDTQKLQNDLVNAISGLDPCWIIGVRVKKGDWCDGA